MLIRLQSACARHGISFRNYYNATVSQITKNIKDGVVKKCTPHYIERIPEITKKRTDIATAYIASLAEEGVFVSAAYFSILDRAFLYPDNREEILDSISDYLIGLHRVGLPVEFAVNKAIPAILSDQFWYLGKEMKLFFTLPNLLSQYKIPSCFLLYRFFPEAFRLRMIEGFSSLSSGLFLASFNSTIGPRLESYVVLCLNQGFDPIRIETLLKKIFRSACDESLSIDRIAAPPGVRFIELMLDISKKDTAEDIEQRIDSGIKNLHSALEEFNVALLDQRVQKEFLARIKRGSHWEYECQGAGYFRTIRYNNVLIAERKFGYNGSDGDTIIFRQPPFNLLRALAPDIIGWFESPFDLSEFR